MHEPAGPLTRSSANLYVAKAAAREGPTAVIASCSLVRPVKVSSGHYAYQPRLSDCHSVPLPLPPFAPQGGCS